MASQHFLPGTAEVEDRQHRALALPVPAEAEDAAAGVVLHLSSGAFRSPERCGKLDVFYGKMMGK